MVVCSMAQCPYWNERGFCGKRVTYIDQNGMCGLLWKNGQQKTVYTDPSLYIKQNVEVEDVE